MKRMFSLLLIVLSSGLLLVDFNALAAARPNVIGEIYLLEFVKPQLKRTAADEKKWLEEIHAKLSQDSRFIIQPNMAIHANADTGESHNHFTGILVGLKRANKSVDGWKTLNDYKLPETRVYTLRKIADSMYEYPPKAGIDYWGMDQNAFLEHTGNSNLMEKIIFETEASRTFSNLNSSRVQTVPELTKQVFQHQRQAVITLNQLIFALDAIFEKMLELRLTKDFHEIESSLRFTIKSNLATRHQFENIGSLSQKRDIEMFFAGNSAVYDTAFDFWTAVDIYRRALNMALPMRIRAMRSLSADKELIRSVLIQETLKHWERMDPLQVVEELKAAISDAHVSRFEGDLESNDTYLASMAAVINSWILENAHDSGFIAKVKEQLIPALTLFKEGNRFFNSRSEISPGHMYRQSLENTLQILITGKIQCIPVFSPRKP